MANCAELTEERKETTEKYDCNGNSPLHVVCYEGDIERLFALLHESNYLNSQNDNGATPLMCIIQGADCNVNNKNSTKEKLLKMMKILVEHGADVNLQDCKGNTALHLAIEQACMKSIFSKSLSYLIKNGAKTNIRNNNNERSTDRAIKSNSSKIIDIVTFTQAQCKTDCLLEVECPYDHTNRIQQAEIGKENISEKSEIDYNGDTNQNKQSMKYRLHDIKRINRVDSIYECPICCSSYEKGTPIYQCVNGHVICEKCWQSLTIVECPSCRVDMKDLRVRNRALEALILKANL